MSEGGNVEAGSKPRQTRGATSVREAMLEELIGDIDSLVSKLDSTGDKVGKQFNAQVRSALQELKESNVEVIGSLRMTLKENQKAREQLNMSISEPLNMLMGLLSNTPHAIRRNWWFGFSVGLLGGLFIGAMCLVGFIWKYW